MLNRMRNRDSSPKLDVQIQLHDGRTYTSRDHVAGVVTLTVVDDRDIPFVKLDIELIGISTFIIRTLSMSTGTPYKLDHHNRFLELKQPDVMSYAPIDRVLKRGLRYEVPFDFTVPDRILAPDCAHEGQTCEEHTYLPPTLDDTDRSRADGVTTRYRVVARLWQAGGHEDESQRTLIAIKSAKVRIAPSVPAEHAVGASTLDEYVPHQQISIKSKASAQHNKLSISAIEPAPLPLSLCEGARQHASSTILPITLHFDGGNESARPPRLGKLKLDVLIDTFLRSTPRDDGHWIQSYYDPTETITLSIRSAANIAWNKHRLGLGDCDIHNTRSPADLPAIPASCKTEQLASNECNHGSCYRANIVVPVVLPQTNNLVPTFQTCSIWRSYRLRISLDVHCMTLGRARIVVLQVPLCVSTQCSITPRPCHVSGDVSSDRLVARCAIQHFENGMLLGEAENDMIESSTEHEFLPEYTVREYSGRNGYQDVRPFR